MRLDCPLQAEDWGGGGRGAASHHLGYRGRARARRGGAWRGDRSVVKVQNADVKCTLARYLCFFFSLQVFNLPCYGRSGRWACSSPYDIPCSGASPADHSADRQDLLLPAVPREVRLG